jgi:phenylpyruvate tautomerase PptA (4-oxalocrotonate tautomerase family)
MRRDKDMPFIDSKVTVKLSEEEKEFIKEKLGRKIEVFGKTENWLMLGFEDQYDLYFAGKKMERAAYVSVRLYGKVSDDACNAFTAAVCDVFEEMLGIPASAVYVSYLTTNQWGWNGGIF